MKHFKFRGKDYIIIRSNQARSMAYLYKVILRVVGYKIMSYKGCNEVRETEYTRKRARIIKQIDYYRNKIEFLSPAIDEEFVEERDYWIDVNQRLLDAHQQELLKLEYDKILGRIE